MFLDAESRHWCTWCICFVRMATLKTSKRCVAWHIYYYIPASFLLQLKLRNISLWGLFYSTKMFRWKSCVFLFLFFVFHRNEPNIFCCIFSFRNALFFMRTVCGFQINAVVWIVPEPTSLSSEKKWTGSISLLVFL